MCEEESKAPESDAIQTVCNLSNFSGFFSVTFYIVIPESPPPTGSQME